MSTGTRVPAHPIAPFFSARWSPRAFVDVPLDDAELSSLFEAARWAPSANNSQPWRFIYARKGTPHWNHFLSLLNENNQRWAARASVLIVLLSKTTHVRAGEATATPLRNHSLDAGAAWLSLAIQAEHQGWRTHAIGGFDRDRARQLLEVPADFAVEIAIAVGKQADALTLPDDLRSREVPNQRLPLNQIAAEGRFEWDTTTTQ